MATVQYFADIEHMLLIYKLYKIKTKPNFSPRIIASAIFNFLHCFYKHFWKAECNVYCGRGGSDPVSGLSIDLLSFLLCVGGRESHRD